MTMKSLSKAISVNGGQFRGTKLDIPSQEITRPNNTRTREAFFNILRSKYSEQIPFTKMLDCFGGSGIFAFEAISQNIAKETLAIEKDPHAFSVIKQNLNKLCNTDDTIRNRVSIRNSDILEQLPKNADADLIFADPPYGSDIFEKFLKCVAVVRWNRAEDLLIVISTDSTPSPYTKIRDEQIQTYLEIIDERKYGKNKLLFCKLK